MLMVCVCVGVCGRACVCMRACVCVHVYVSVCTHVKLYECDFFPMCVYTHCVCMCLHLGFPDNFYGLYCSANIFPFSACESITIHLAL